MKNEEDPFAETIGILEKKLGIKQEPKSNHIFNVNGEELYRLILPECGITFEVDRLRRERHELIGELCVRCEIVGARTYDGTLSIADFNLSSARARVDRAKLLSVRSAAEALDWLGYIEELCQRVLGAERQGQSCIDLRTIERPSRDDSVLVEGIHFPRRHPTIIYGDGGSAKSYIALYLGCRMVEKGMNVALFDWELAGEDHRDRLERICGPVMPKITYAKCEKPLTYEMDRLRRIVRDEKIDYAIYDSIAFACAGPPESAEIAGQYFRALRQIGVGSLNVAHITKGENGEQKPFGSVFWHNGARCTWFACLSDADPTDERTVKLGLFNKKANLGCLQKPTGFKICFTEDRTYLAKTDPTLVPEFTQRLTISQRMIHLLRVSGAMSYKEISDETGEKIDTIRKTASRNNNLFTVLSGGKVGLTSNLEGPFTN